MSDLPINVDIPTWAQQIREMKIRELKELIKSTNKTDMTRISELKRKLKIIENKKRKTSRK